MAEEQWRTEVEVEPEFGLILNATTTVDILPRNGSAASVQNNGDVEAPGNVDISSSSDSDGGDTSESSVETRETSRVVKEEEIVEVEFEKAVLKLGTHTMHCPNCDSEVNKVVLRRRVITIYQADVEPPHAREQLPVPAEQPHHPAEQPHDPAEQQPPNSSNVVGCLSCFSFFTFADDGRFNPFSIFKRRLSNVPPPQVVGNEREDPLVGDTGSCLSMLRVFRKEQEVEVREGGLGVGVDDTAIDVLPDYVLPESGPGYEIVPSTENLVPVTEESGSASASLEILKSIVYGGLMEVIASLSVVASAAASDAATWRIVALALATLVGGIFIIGHKLWDLRDDCYKGKSSQEMKKEAIEKYKDILGRPNYFPLHAAFAIISYLVFGLVPPVAYGISYYETKDKDHTIMVVAIVSLLCVSLLAIFKAYINRCKGFFEYVKTMVYYITTALSVSGVSFVVGILVMRLIEELGLFDTSLGVALSNVPHATTSSLAAF